ncbi:MAG: helix-turn-helix transcriptional regulator [bacterium]|nr:transcriptional regulator [Deltaproteobacteria bacterium]MCP4908462.1 helix-turn-helix transcriptional regulator [bacterium]
MKRTRFGDAPCPIARTTDLMGDWWTPMVMREAFLGRRRFDEFQKALSVSRGVLAKRLSRLVEEGLLAKHAYEDRPPRFEYLLTEKGRAFYSVLAAMWRFGEDWLWEEGTQSPLQLFDRETGESVAPRVVDERTGEAIDVRQMRLGPRE